MFNGRRYPNNSIIDLQDIGPGDYEYNASVYCLTNLTRCCSGLTEVSWHIPEGLDTSINRNYEYYSTPTQTVNLYRPKSSYVSGVFYCSILDQYSVAVFLYVGIYQRGISEFSFSGHHNPIVPLYISEASELQQKVLLAGFFLVYQVRNLFNTFFNIMLNEP